jgi:2-hydroxychromene-2-carboxylate isomerase
MSRSAGPRVDFYYSIGSRYSYLAASQLDRVASDTGCRFAWRPVESPRLIARRPDDPFAGGPRTGQYTPEYRGRDIARWAALYGIPYVEPVGRVTFDSRVLALACTAALRLGAVEPVSRGLYAAMYDGTLDRIDEAVCARVAAGCGLDAERFTAAMHDPATDAQLDAALDAAERAGVFGVPTFVVDGERFFGNDRLVLLRHHLLQLRTGARGA